MAAEAQAAVGGGGGAAAALALSVSGDRTTHSISSAHEPVLVFDQRNRDLY